MFVGYPPSAGCIPTCIGIKQIPPANQLPFPFLFPTLLSQSTTITRGYLLHGYPLPSAIYPRCPPTLRSLPLGTMICQPRSNHIVPCSVNLSYVSSTVFGRYQSLHCKASLMMNNPYHHCEARQFLLIILLHHQKPLLPVLINPQKEY